MCKCKLDMYENVPDGNIHLQNLEEICLNRLELYKILYKASSECQRYTIEWVKHVLEALKSKELWNWLKLVENKYIVEVCGCSLGRESNVSCEKARFLDHVSHCILGFAYCNNEDLQDFYKKRETEWFTLQIQAVTKETILEFVKHSCKEYRLVQPTEKESLKDSLTASFDMSDSEFDELVFLKSEFSNVLHLLKTRQVYLMKGIAYFPQTVIVSVLQNKFHYLCRDKLVEMRKYLYEDPKNADARIQDLVNNLPKVTVSNLSSNSSMNTINMSNMDEHARKYFPPCMKHLHDLVRTKHHLKHNARLQYGIFLKWTGLPYQDAMNFWREEFTKKMSEEDFVKKKYLYYFKHQYGRVGGRIQYQAAKCEDIIDNTPTATQEHGCPFAHFDRGRLSEWLLRNGAKSNTVPEIMRLKNQKMYIEACRLYFSGVHEGKENNHVTPNQFYCNSSCNSNCDVDIEDLFLSDDSS